MFEVENGVYRLTYEPRHKLPVADYTILFFLVARALEQAGAFRILGKGKHK